MHAATGPTNQTWVDRFATTFGYNTLFPEVRHEVWWAESSDLRYHITQKCPHHPARRQPTPPSRSWALNHRRVARRRWPDPGQRESKCQCIDCDPTPPSRHAPRRPRYSCTTIGWSPRSTAPRPPSSPLWQRRASASPPARRSRPCSPRRCVSHWGRPRGSTCWCTNTSRRAWAGAWARRDADTSLQLTGSALVFAATLAPMRGAYSCLF